MNKIEKKDIIDDIRNYKRQNIEEVLRMAYYTLSSYLYSLMTFGYQHEVTNKASNIWNSFISNLREERKLMNLLIKYASQIDYNETNIFLDDLDDLNEQQIMYYYEALDSIDDACDMKEAWRSNTRKDITFLSEDISYRERLCGMLISLNDIISYMNYPDSFWEYMKSRTTYVEYHDDYDDKADIGITLSHDFEGKLSDFKLTIPCITNLYNALIAIDYYRKAYNYYLQLGKQVEDNADISLNKESFKEKYLAIKYPQIF